MPWLPQWRKHCSWQCFLHLEESDALAATVEKALPRAFVINGHAKKVDVEVLRAGEIFDMKNHVVYTGDFELCLHGGPPK
jgi:hypothetical protein